MPNSTSRYRGMYEKGRKTATLDSPIPSWIGRSHADRAVQFMPFAALRGYEAMIDTENAKADESIIDFWEMEESC